MRKIILFAAACFFLQISFAKSIFPSVTLSQFSLIVQSHIKVAAENTVQKRMTLKERILLKWFKKKMNRTVSEEKQKKNVKLLGYLSSGLFILSPILLVSLFAITSYGVVQVLAVFALLLLPVSIILGIISLRKRKKLADKTGTSAVPALIGIILSSAFLLLILIALISFSNGFDYNFSW